MTDADKALSGEAILGTFIVFLCFLAYICYRAWRDGRS